jgi:hypothetical protein
MAASTQIVQCGEEVACKLADLYPTLERFSVFIVQFLFPMIFFTGIFLTVLPILKNPDSPENRAQAKANFIKLGVGTLFITGAYFIIKSILLGLGVYDTKIVPAPATTTYAPVQMQIQASSFAGFIERAHAQDFPSTDPAPSTPAPASSDSIGTFANPLKDVTIQGVLMGIANIVFYFAILGVVYGTIRGVLYLLLTQENPDNLRKGKVWLLWSMVAAVLVLGANTFLNVIINGWNSVFK